MNSSRIKKKMHAQVDNYKTIRNRGKNVQEMLTGKREYISQPKCWLLNIIKRAKGVKIMSKPKNRTNKTFCKNNILYPKKTPFNKEVQTETFLGRLKITILTMSKGKH